MLLHPKTYTWLSSVQSLSSQDNAKNYMDACDSWDVLDQYDLLLSDDYFDKFNSEDEEDDASFTFMEEYAPLAYVPADSPQPEDLQRALPSLLNST
eukprot:2622011-Ditylum_brightwellii.AAC.1